MGGGGGAGPFSVMCDFAFFKVCDHGVKKKKQNLTL